MSFCGPQQPVSAPAALVTRHVDTMNVRLRCTWVKVHQNNSKIARHDCRCGRVQSCERTFDSTNPTRCCAGWLTAASKSLRDSSDFMCSASGNGTPGPSGFTRSATEGAERSVHGAPAAFGDGGRSHDGSSGQNEAADCTCWGQHCFQVGCLCGFSFPLDGSSSLLFATT